MVRQQAGCMTRCPRRSKPAAVRSFSGQSRRRVERLEILDVQIVHSHFDGERLFDERHQLDGKQGVDDARFEQIVVIVQVCDVDRAQDETPDGFLDSVFFVYS